MAFYHGFSVNLMLRNEVFDGIFREELAKLTAELCGEGLIVRENERGAVQVGDYVGHGKGLTRARDSKQRLIFHARLKSRGKPRDRLGLISRGLIRRV